jgi:hypothetical protein
MAVKSNMWTRRGGVKPVYNLMGVTDLRQFVQGIDPWVQRRLIHRTMEQSCKVMVEQAKNNIVSNDSVDTGALKKSMGLVIREYPKSRHITAVIGPRIMSFVRGKTGRARSAKSSDKSQGMIKPFKYAHLVEFGHYSAAATGVSVADGTKGTSRRKHTFPTRSFIQGKPFLRPAYESSKAFVEARVMAAFKEALQREVARMAKKLNKMVKLAA